jgi:hypothetical protein
VIDKVTEKVMAEVTRRVTPRPAVVLAVAVTLCFHAGTGLAQSANAAVVGRFELSVGTVWFGTAAVGSRDATLTGSGGGGFRLFSTSSELGGATGVHVRVGGCVTHVIEAEASASYASPLLTTSIANDAENAAPTSVSESVRQFTIEGGALVNLTRWRFGSRVFPFVTAGGGYLRQLHEGGTLAQTGKVGYVGGGARIPLVSRGARERLKQLGVRADLRALVRSGGVTLDGQSHLSPALAASLFVNF